MRTNRKILPTGQKKLKRFMTAKQYRQFTERFYAEVKPELDRQQEARRRSEEAARLRMVG